MNFLLWQKNDQTRTMLEKLGIIGVSNAIGIRLLEHFHIAQKADTRAILISSSEQSYTCRFNIATQLLEKTNDINLIARALRGLNSLVYCPSEMSSLNIKNLYLGAQKAGLEKLVFISSAHLHGYNPRAGTSESSPINTRKLNKYLFSLYKAEQQLQKLRIKNDLKYVILRPGFIYGARAPIALDWAKNLQQGVAKWSGYGKGIFNGTNLNNLAQAVEQAIIIPGDGQAFLILDDESSQWRDLYLPLTQALGYEEGDIAELKPNTKNSGPSNALLHKLKLWLSPRSQTPRWKKSYNCNWSVQSHKAKDLLDYAPIFSLQEGIEDMIEWLRFSGYPICTPEKPPPDLIMHL